MNYPKTVAAAVAETKSKFALAEALATEIPPRKHGPKVEENVVKYLEDARQAIIDGGGEKRAVGTLRNYRQTALWVRHVNVPNFRWVEGSSFTAHQEAMLSGVSYEEFAANPKTARELRQDADKASKDGPPSSVIPGWSYEQQAEAAATLLANFVVAQDPGVQEAIVAAVVKDDGMALKVAVGREEARQDKQQDEKPSKTKGAFDYMTGLGIGATAINSTQKLGADAKALTTYIREHRDSLTGEDTDAIDSVVKKLLKASETLRRFATEIRLAKGDEVSEGWLSQVLNEV